jgi:putative transposase
MIGRIAVRWSRPTEGTIKTVTVSKEADGWYVCFSCAEVPTQPLPLTGRETGMDVGLKVFLITAEGDVVENQRHYSKAEHDLKKAQKPVSRRKQGSKRRAKAARQCTKTHQHVRRQRRDFHHKTALALLRQYDVIYVEAIQPANLSRRPDPKPAGTGGYEHNGGKAESGPQQKYAGRRMGPIPLYPRVQGSMGRQARASGQPGVYVAGLLRLWRTYPEVPERSHPCLYELWPHAGPR